MPACWMIIPAAGAGRRFGAEQPKQYLTVAGQPVLQHTVSRMLAVPDLAGLVLVVAADDTRWRSLPVCADSRVHVVTGGAERVDSVRAGLAALDTCADDRDWVLVHDAVRPCLRAADVEALLDALADDPVGGLLAMPVSDTLKQADAGGRVARTVDRTHLWRAQTPQCFRRAVLREALVDAGDATDESRAVEQLGHAPRLVPGPAYNLKMTHPDDRRLIEALLADQKEND